MLGWTKIKKTPLPIKENIDTLNYISIKTFCLSKDHPKESEATEREKIF